MEKTDIKPALENYEIFAVFWEKYSATYHIFCGNIPQALPLVYL